MGIESDNGSIPPQDLNIIVHKNSNFLATKEIFIANSVSTVHNEKVIINIINLSNNDVTLFKGDVLIRASILYNKTQDDTVGFINESKGLSDNELKDAYREILLAQLKLKTLLKYLRM